MNSQSNRPANSPVQVLLDPYDEAGALRMYGPEASNAARKVFLDIGRRAAQRGRALGRKHTRAASRCRAMADESRRAARSL